MSWVDVIAGVSATPGVSQGHVTAIASTVMVAAAASGTFRQIKSVFIRNTHATKANTLSVNKDVSSTDYILTPDATLQPGESLTYESGSGWSTNSVLVSTLTDDLHLGFQDWTAISNPAPPSADILRVYARKISGRTMPKWTPPSGLDTSFQPAFFGNNIVFWQPGATSGVLSGSVGTAIAAGVATLPTSTNRYTALRRSVFTVATGANLMNGYRSENMFFRGNASGAGGFFFFCRFGLNVYTAGNRGFVGLAVDTTAMLTAEPSTKLNLLGFGLDGADSAFTFMHNDGSGTATKDTIAGQPALASQNAYDAYIFCKPNDTTVYYRLDNIIAGTTIIDTSTSTNLPVNTTMLNMQCSAGSGANAGAAVASVGLNRLYCETDF